MLEENWDTVQVFQRCAQHYLVGMAGYAALGFSATEIASGCRLYRLPPRRWPDVSAQVLHMGRIAAGVMNERKR